MTKKNDEYIKSITGGQGVIDAQTGELRSTFDILQDLSKAWENLTSVERQELTETVAGKTQRALFTALMTNFSTAVGATEAALNSEGSALEENNKRMNSLQGRLKQLDSAWQSFSRNTINSEWVKNILNATTELIKFIDKIGGLPIVLATATSALMLFKGGLILDKSFKVFSSGLDLMKNGIITLVTALPNAISGFRAFSAGIVSAGTAIQAAVPLFTVIALAITGVVAAINAFAKAQEEANAAAIEDSKEATKIIENKTKQKETIEDEIKKLKEEKDAYINSAKAKGQDTSNDEWIKSKDEEISKRQKNIETIDKEITKQLEQRESAARSIKFKKADTTGLGAGNVAEIAKLSASLQIDKLVKYSQILAEGNERLKEAGTNTGAYKKILEDYRAEINEVIKAKEEAKENTEAETLALQFINNELGRNSEKYEEDAKSAEELYSILKSGGTISQEQIDWLKKFYNLNDEQINQLKNGKDVLNENTSAISENNKEVKNANKLADQYQSALNSNIDSMINYGKNMDLLKTAQAELSNSGAITAETFQSLTENNLLGYLDEVNGKLTVNTTAFADSTSSIKEYALANLQASTYEQIRAVVLADLQSQQKDNTTEAKNAASQMIETGKDAVKMGQDLITAAGDAAQLNVQLAAIAGTSYTPSSDASAKIDEILKKAQKTQSFINSWKPSSSKSATKKASSGKKASKSSKEEYKAEIDTLYNYENALDNAKDAVDRLNDALKNTDNFNEREKYLKQLINATKDEIEATNNLRDAQTRQINDYIKQLRKQGFQISYNSKTNELNINNMERLGKFSGDTAKNLEKMIKKIQDLNKDNRTLDGSVRDLNADIKDFNEQLEELPTEKLEKFNELMEKFQQSRLDQIQNQIDDIQHEMENDPRLKALEAQIEALEKQNDELDSQKELEEKILAVEQAKDKLANQRKQKTIQIYRENQRMGKIMPSSIVICCVISNYIGQSPEMDKTEVRLNLRSYRMKREREKNGMYKRLTNEEFLLKVYEKLPYIKIKGKYYNNKQKIEYECTKCGYNGSSKAIHLIEGHGCPVCGKVKKKTIRIF